MKQTFIFLQTNVRLKDFVRLFYKVGIAGLKKYEVIMGKEGMR